MQATTLQKAIQEAKRFIEIANSVPMHKVNPTIGKPWITIDSGKESGLMKAQSIILSRCLADLRQGR